MDFVVSQSSYHYIVISLHTCNMAFGKKSMVVLIQNTGDNYASQAAHFFSSNDILTIFHIQMHGPPMLIFS